MTDLRPMHDAFALLELPRRPWLDEDEVRSAFQRRAARVHPDASAGTDADFAELTKAYRTLREPASRLRHLLELDSPGATSPTGIPAEVSPIFPVVARVRGEIDRWNRQPRKAGGALERAVLGSELTRIRRAGESAQHQLSEAMTSALDELREIDGAWPCKAAVEMLLVLQARLAFLEKWNAQLREALLQLDIGHV